MTEDAIAMYIYDILKFKIQKMRNPSVPKRGICIARAMLIKDRKRIYLLRLVALQLSPNGAERQVWKRLQLSPSGAERQVWKRNMR